jgi:predicted aldo/keto reductase-like oxidoreductase
VSLEILIFLTDSVIGSLQHRYTQGTCIYCNHCQPCPSGIDIGSINKYLDLAKAGDELAKDHYLKLSKNTKDALNVVYAKRTARFMWTSAAVCGKQIIILISEDNS